MKSDNVNNIKTILACSTIIIFIITLCAIFVIMSSLNFDSNNLKSSDNDNKNESKCEFNEVLGEYSEEEVHKVKEYVDPNMVLSEKEKMFVCHAGGKYDKYYYLNCKEAIDNSYERGYKLIEIDVAWTSDNVPILLHGWGDNNTNFLDIEKIQKKVTLKEFMNLKMVDNLTQVSLEYIANCIRNDTYKGVYFITDTKDDNTKLLEYISTEYKDIMNWFIPQIYNQDEYHLAKKLGFENIIYTLYKSNDKQDEIVNFAKEYKPFAITMDTYWAHVKLPLLLSKENIYTYTYTLNNMDDFNFLKTNGIKGIYTDILFE